eukprot:1186320-Prorocentrum_minimum.AAC.1
MPERLEPLLGGHPRLSTGLSTDYRPQIELYGYMRGTNVQNAGVGNVVNIQDSQEQAPGCRGGLEGV